MSGKVPHAAFCEEYDEDSHATRPETRRVANVAAKRSRSDLRSAAEPFVDLASDSGYSSRTAATVNSTQSAPSGRKSPVPLKLDTALKKADLQRVRSHRKERTKDRAARPAREEKMQVGAYPSAHHQHQHLHHHSNHTSNMQRSPSRSRRRDSAQVRHYPGTCWECDQGLYHATNPIESRSMDYSSYYMSQPSTPSVHDYPPQSPQTPRYPPSSQDVMVSSHSSRPHGRSGRSDSYHASSRPMSSYGMVPGMGGVMYNPNAMGRYDHHGGPPLSSSAYANTPPYGPYSQQSPFYHMPDYAPQEHHQERSVSRTRDQGRGRRSSAYGPPVVDYDQSSQYDDDEPVVDHGPPPPPPAPPTRDSRPRLPSHSSHDRDEDYYRMPPPPLKHKATPHIIQKRPHLPHKPATTTAVSSERRSSRSMDLSDMRDALPEYGYRRSSRETVIPERSRSIRDSRHSASYHENPRPSRVAIEGARRRRTTVYDYGGEGGDDDDGDEIEDKQREAEEYQASRSAKAPPVPPVPLTADALYKAKGSSRAESDSGSQKSRSNSSRGSDARTQSGSGVGAKPEDDNNIVMTMNGVTMSFTQESVGGKRISVRTGDTGAVELNIEGKRPKKYLTGGSDYTGSVSRRGEIEDARRPRGDRRSVGGSHRSSRSTYSGRF